jgi:hypothetical protein
MEGEEREGRGEERRVEEREEREEREEGGEGGGEKKERQ